MTDLLSMAAPMTALQSAANYSYPITTGLLSGLSQAPQGSIPQGGPWSQLAYQMAGSPKQGGMYAPVATPAAPPGSSSSGSSLASLLPLLGGLLGGGGALGGGGGTSGLNSIVNALGGLLGGSSQLPSLNSSGSSIYGSAANTGNLGSNPIGAPNENVGDPGAGLDFSTGNIDLSGSDGNSGDINSLLQSLGFSGAGGQAAIPGSAAATGSIGGEYNSDGSELQSPSAYDSLLGTPQSQGANLSGMNGGSSPSVLGNAAGLLGIGQGIASGSPTGYAGAGLGAASLASKNNLFGTSSSSLGSAAGTGLSALGLYQGLQQGGVTGDVTAAANAAKLAGSLGSATGLLSSGVGSALSAAGGYVAAPLALYNLATNWQSGDTGGDAMQGAEAGGTVGSVFGPVGTLIGGLIGAAGGALSSAFGGGKQDPETQNTYAVNSAGSNAASQLNPAQSFQYLAGVLDAKNNTAGHSTDLEQVFGRQGEGALLDQMTGAVNNAVSSGQMTQNPDGSVSFKTGGGTVIYSADNAQQAVYNQIVLPWLNSKGVSSDSLTFTDAKGNSSGTNLQQSLVNLLGAYMGGQLTSATPIGASGQADSSLAAYAGRK